MKLNKLLLSIFVTGLIFSCTENQSNTLSSHQQNTKSPNTSLEQLKSKEEIGKAARLTPDQVKKLLPVDSKLIPIVPTYIPSDFEIVDFMIIPFEISKKFDYRIKYYNSSSNECFRIGATVQVGGDPTEYHEKVQKINSLIDTINLGYTKFSQISNEPRLSSSFSLIKDKEYYADYYFESPYTNDKLKTDCKIITFREAQKIVESFQYLTHHIPPSLELYDYVRSNEDKLY